MVTVRHR